MRTVYRDERHTVDVSDHNHVALMIEAFHGETFFVNNLEPEEAIALGNALVAAGAEAGAQCCADGCSEVATEFGDTIPEDWTLDNS